jgi:hypothetical protein
MARIAIKVDMALKWRGKNEFSLGSPESYTLSVANNGDDTLEAQDVVLEEDTYRRQIIAHLPKIAPGSTASVDFTTEIKPRMTIRDLPYSVSFRLKTTNYRQRFINCGLGLHVDNNNHSSHTRRDEINDLSYIYRLLQPRIGTIQAQVGLRSQCVQLAGVWHCRR